MRRTTPLLLDNLASLAVPGAPSLAEPFFFFSKTPTLHAR